MTIEDIAWLLMLMWIGLMIYDIALTSKIDRLEEKIDTLIKASKENNKYDS